MTSIACWEDLRGRKATILVYGQEHQGQVAEVKVSSDKVELAFGFLVGPIWRCQVPAILRPLDDGCGGITFGVHGRVITIH